MRILSDFYKKMSRADYDDVTFDDIIVSDDDYNHLIMYSLTRATLSEIKAAAAEKNYDILFK